MNKQANADALHVVAHEGAAEALQGDPHGHRQQAHPINPRPNSDGQAL